MLVGGAGVEVPPWQGVSSGACHSSHLCFRCLSALPAVTEVLTSVASHTNVSTWTCAASDFCLF